MTIKIISTLILFFAFYGLPAQERDGYRQAMQDELQRNITQLQIPGLQPLFFISYAVAEGTSVMIKAQDGCIIQSQADRTVMPVVRTLTGDYQMTNEVAGQFRNAVMRQLPLDGNYDETRRVLWLSTDAAYKMSAQEYTAKTNMIRQMNIQADELGIPDLSKIPPVQKHLENPVPPVVKKEKLEKYMQSVTAELEKYNELEKSSVLLYGFLGDLYYINSEGTDICFPQNGLTLVVTAGVYTPAYTYLDRSFSVAVSSPEELPALSELKKQIRELAGHLRAIRELKPMAESFFGPVLLENTAVGDFMDLCLVPQLINQKAWLGQKNVKLPEGKLGKKLVASGFSVLSLPLLERYQGRKLCGAFALDYDGVTPREMPLVEDGLVKNLLNNRICTKKIRVSNGYCRPNPENGMMPMVAPGVLKMTSATHLTADGEMKHKLIEATRKEGLDYAYRVRDIQFVNGQMKAAEIYRVYTDGHEEYEQSGLLNLSPASLRRITYMSEREYIDNKTTNGMQVTYIYPASMLVEEAEVDPFEGQSSQPPLVENPKTLFTK